MFARELSSWRTSPGSSKCSELDQLKSESGVRLFASLVAKYPEFRSILHFRLKGSLPASALLLIRLAWRGQSSLLIEAASIGPGLFIQHGFSTIIDAESIGANFWINQQVTVGWTRQGRPVIGDNVHIGAAAVVVGRVYIGDDATIGANTTIVQDVVAGSTVVSAAVRAN